MSTETPTPRTNAYYGVLASQPTHHVRGTMPDIDFARTLERELYAANEKLAKARPSEEAVNAARFIVSVSASRQANIAARELLRLDELAKPNRKE